jgi:hypothetical protein
MPDTYVTMQDVADDMLIAFQNQLKVVNTATQVFDKQFTNGHKDKGATLQVQRPNNNVVGDGATITTILDNSERYVNLTIDQRKHVVLDFLTKDLTLYARQDFFKRFIEPGAKALASVVDLAVADAMCKQAANFVGTPGVALSDESTIWAARSLMNKLGMPYDERYAFISEDMYQNVGHGLKSLFQPALVKDIIEDAMIGRLSGFDFFSTIHTRNHLSGTGDTVAAPAAGFVTAGTIAVATVSGDATLALTGILPSQTGVFKAGDKIYVDGVDVLGNPVYLVNPIDFTSTGKLACFEVTADVNSTIGGTATVPISIANTTIITDDPHPYRNLTGNIEIGGQVYLATARTGAGASVAKTYSVGMAYHPSSILFAAPPLIMPKAIPDAAKGVQTDPQTGISIRILETYDSTYDKVLTRMDIIYGLTVLQDRCVAVLGA